MYSEFYTLTFTLLAHSTGTPRTIYATPMDCRHRAAWVSGSTAIDIVMARPLPTPICMHAVTHKHSNVVARSVCTLRSRVVPCASRQITDAAHCRHRAPVHQAHRVAPLVRSCACRPCMMGVKGAHCPCMALARTRRGSRRPRRSHCRWGGPDRLVTSPSRPARRQRFARGGSPRRGGAAARWRRRH